MPGWTLDFLNIYKKNQIVKPYFICLLQIFYHHLLVRGWDIYDVV